MIAGHQPTIFPAGLTARVSSVADGTMKWGTAPDTEVEAHRQRFLAACDLPREVAIPQVLYEGDDYCRYATATVPGIITADALATQTPGLPIFLPLADCTGAILYDPVCRVLMVSHLGRHSTEQRGAERSVAYLCARFGSDPADLLVWLSPSPGARTYPLWQFDHRSFTDVLTEQFLAAGVSSAHLEHAHIDTATSFDYFSHSQFLRGRQAIDGRYAVVAMLR